MEKKDREHPQINCVTQFRASLRIGIDLPCAPVSDAWQYITCHARTNMEEKWQRAALDGQKKRSLPRQGALSGQRHDCHMLRKLKKKSRVMLSLKKCPIEVLFT